MSDGQNAPEITMANLMGRMEASWNDVNAFLGGLSAEQLTGPRDAAGWSVKDHVIHMALWEDGMVGFLEGAPRHEAMGVDKETWERGADAVNEVLQRRYADLPLDEALARFQAAHGRMLAKLATMTDADLVRPYRDFDPEADESDFIVWWIGGNTFMHYPEHKPWMAAIVGQS